MFRDSVMEVVQMKTKIAPLSFRELEEDNQAFLDNNRTI